MVKFHGVDVPSDHKLATVRKAEKVQTNGIKFEGGSWLMKNDIDAKKLVYSYEYGKSFVDTGWCKYQLLLGSL